MKIGDAIKSGFAAHGKKSEISHDPNTQADMHVVLGPWFALNQWKYHQNVLYIDRAYWGDPGCISIHWLSEGEKVRTSNNEYRWHPDTKPYKHGHRKIYLLDYDEKWGHQATDGDVRYHPAQSTPKRTLEEDLRTHDIAVGRRTTALVDACIHGLMVLTNDPHSPVYPVSGSVSYIKRAELLVNLAWHNWSLKEIECGAMWDVLGSANKSN